MKKMISLLIALALLLCAFAALAESDYTYYPELEDFVGTWHVDDYILEIVHSDDDYNVLNCVVTRYDAGGKTGTRWIYDACAYDDVGNALASVEIGHRLECGFDGGELVSSEAIYTDGAAAFALNGDGTLTWTDFKETPGENERVFEKTVPVAEIDEMDAVDDEGQGAEADAGAFDIDALQIAKSPEWVKALPQAQDEAVAQLFIVAGMGMDNTTATISMHRRDADGNWQQILSTPGFVGKNGLCLDTDHVEGCGQTPLGVYRFNKAFGIAADPGCALDYIQVNDDTYWSGDPNYHYNEMMQINDYPELAMDDSEHIVDYTYQYQYCLNISFNEEGTPGRGSAIFLHCLGPTKPYTGGCVAIPQNIMELVMQNVSEDCVVVIDTVENLGVTF